MLIIGLLGGIASGKSLVSAQLAQLGARVLDADRAGHEALLEPAVRDLLTNRWGPSVLDERQQINRRAVAAIVFGRTEESRRELAFLEQVTHPRITRSIQQQIERLRVEKATAAVLDAPVMLKAGWDKFCDKIVFVEADRQTRLQRARQRGWDEAEFDAREGAQESLDEKRRRADVIIDNSRTPERTFAQVQLFWKSLSW